MRKRPTRSSEGTIQMLQKTTINKKVTFPNLLLARHPSCFRNTQIMKSSKKLIIQLAQTQENCLKLNSIIKREQKLKG
jgi:hypothetical protein